MTEPFKSKPYPVPAGQVRRLTQLSGLAAGIAGRAVVGSGQALLSGQRPKLADLIITPQNAAKITENLAQMRGAAMKVGQLLSMEAGDMLPPELSSVLAHLRADAHFMPPQQLKSALTAAWGANFQRKFKRFETRPLAAASIGQVHRAVTRDGRDLAIKVQYPGVRRSIDSDVRNVGMLMRMSGMVPKGMDMGPLLDEARTQLHDEANYTREGQALERFGARLKDAPGFLVPKLHADLTTETVLAMDYVSGSPIEEVNTLPPAVRDSVADRMIRLMLRELFEFAEMQTDPNFANYRYQADTDRIVLLDFGAAREFPIKMVHDYRQLLHAGLSGNREAIRAAMDTVGLFGQGVTPHQEERMLDIFGWGMDTLTGTQPHNFGTCDLDDRIRDAVSALAQDRDFAPVPPVDTLFLQRKIGGLYLLAKRLKASVDLQSVLAPYQDHGPAAAAE
ncbi:MAG: AarF/ABC1/UbiB kinase family protein [Pseudomonadota bacterium]